VVTPEKWRRVEEIYSASLKHDAGRRREFLVEVCANDADVLHQVELLLRRRSSPEVVLPPPNLLDSQLAGSSLGPYQILDRIGAGGMG
jgi:hypothetical protein